MQGELEVTNVPFPAGRFDASFNLVDGNKLVYDFIGNNLYSSIFKMLPESNHRKITSAMADCDNNPEAAVDKTIHVFNGKGGVDKYVITVQKCENQDYYYATFINVSDSERIINEINGRLERARDLLTLSGDAVFEYTHTDNHYKMYWINHEQNVMLCDMDFDEWKKSVLDSGQVEAEDVQTFVAFCDTIKKLDDSQKFSLHGSFITNGERMDSYYVKFVSKDYKDQDMVVGTWSIINEITGAQIENFFEDSYMDPLTRLLNKKSITEYAKTALTKGKDIAIAVMDIDNFKGVNDTYGHMFGDKVIRATADVIKQAVGTMAVAGRMGGDEFMIVFEDYKDELTLRNMLRCIKTNMANIYQGKMGNKRLSCSIGVSRFDRDADNYKELFQIADKCLYIAKQKGKNRYIIYEPEKHGQFMASDKSPDMLEMRGDYYAESDIFHINQLLSNVLVHGDTYMQTLLDQVAYTLMMDRVTLFWGDGLELRCMNSAAENLPKIDPFIVRNEQYLALFKEDILPMNNVNMIEYSIPEVHQILKESGTYSSLQHILRDVDGNIRGIVCGDCCKNYVTFPKVAIQIFENFSEVINAYLIRGEK